MLLKSEKDKTFDDLQTKYKGKYFFTLEEVKEIFNTTYFIILNQIKMRAIFAVRIGVAYRMFLDLDCEIGLIPSTNFWIPDELKASDIADILKVSLEMVEKYIMKIYTFSMSRQDFLGFLYNNSNIKQEKVSRRTVIPRTVSRMISRTVSRW